MHYNIIYIYINKVYSIIIVVVVFVDVVTYKSICVICLTIEYIETLARDNYISFLFYSNTHIHISQFSIIFNI